jgi:hypothetical protein
MFELSQIIQAKGLSAFLHAEDVGNGVRRERKEKLPCFAEAKRERSAAA